MNNQVLLPLYIESMSNLEGKLKSYSGFLVQLSFFRFSDFKKLDHEIIQDLLTKHSISLHSIHFPTIDADSEHFVQVVNSLKERYGVRLFTLHPQNSIKEKILKKLENLVKIFEDSHIELAYENFPSSSKKWVKLPEEISSLPFEFTYLTFDTSHLDRYTCPVEELKKYIGKVRVIHLSNRKFDLEGNVSEHRPIKNGEIDMLRLLPFLRDNYDGGVVLDYAPQYFPEMFKDAGKLSDFFRESNYKIRYYPDLEHSNPLNEEDLSGKLYWKVFFIDGDMVREERYLEDGTNDWRFSFFNEGEHVNDFSWKNEEFVSRKIYKRADVDRGFGQYEEYNSSGLKIGQGKL